MTLWIIIFYTSIFITAIAFFYLCSRLPHFDLINRYTHDREKEHYKTSPLIVLMIFGITALILNMVNAFVITIYFAMIWGICDICAWCIRKYRKQSFKRYYAGIIAIILSLTALIYGWHLDHHVWQQNYNLTTTKNIPPLKIALFADSHIGTTFDASGFAGHLSTIQNEQPDMLLIAGDFVDDETTKEDMIAATQALGKFKSKYGVYFALGNHDKGYYGATYRGFSAEELIAELQKNNVKVLRDEAHLIEKSFYIIGRRDFSEIKERTGHRKSMTELIQNLDKSAYMLVIDHQPTDYQNQTAAKVDLVVSGHTHGGQLFPFNQVGKWIGANDLIYGHEHRDNTDFIVTSGLSDWAIKFKTGTRSEYVIINLREKEQ